MKLKEKLKLKVAVQVKQYGTPTLQLLVLVENAVMVMLNQVDTVLREMQAVPKVVLEVVVLEVVLVPQVFRPIRNL